MPLLGGLFTGLFSGLVAWLGQFVTRKIAFGLAAVASMTALTTGLFVTMRVVLAGLNSYTTGLPGILANVLLISVPPASAFCVSSYLTIWTACTVYAWQRDLLHLYMKA